MPKITVFTTNTCAYCSMVKAWLQRKGYDYKEVNLEEHPERQQEVFQMSGSFTVPITLIEHDQKKAVVIGFNLSNLAPAINRLMS